MTGQRTRAASVVGGGVSQVAERLWDAVVDGDDHAAGRVVVDALDAGVPPEDVLLQVIAPVQHRVGTEWAANKLTVAQEHAATAINDRAIATLAHHPAARSTATAGRVLVACVDGEWHALPARLLAEVLRLRGWQVDFLGAQVPTPYLIAHLHQHGPDVVALSCMIPTRLPAAHAAITACQAAGVAVLTGGAAFGPDGRYARLLGADAWASDARAAAAKLEEGVRRVGSTGTHQAIDDLPHLADQEYTMVSGRAAQLVASTLAALDPPAAGQDTEALRLQTSEDVAHIVDFLATALYVDDDELFTGFLAWTDEIRLARGIPAGSLFPTLSILAAALRDFPRAQRFLTAARDALVAVEAKSHR